MFLYNPSIADGEPFNPFNYRRTTPDKWNVLKAYMKQTPGITSVPGIVPDMRQEGIFFTTFFPTVRQFEEARINPNHEFHHLARIFVVTLIGDRVAVLNDPNRSFLIDDTLRARVELPIHFLDGFLNSGLDGITITQRPAIKERVTDPDQVLDLSPAIIKNIPVSSMIFDSFPLPIGHSISLQSIAAIYLSLLPVSRLIKHYDGGSFIHINYNLEQGEFVEPPTLELIARISKRDHEQKIGGPSSSLLNLLHPEDIIRLESWFLRQLHRNPKQDEIKTRTAHTSERRSGKVIRLEEHLQRMSGLIRDYGDELEKILARLEEIEDIQERMRRLDQIEAELKNNKKPA